MAPIEHELTNSLFELPHAVNGVHNSRVCDAFCENRSGSLHCHHATRVVVFVPAERLGQGAAV